MATNFPSSLDNSTSLPNPSSSNAPNSPSHAGLHTSENGAIIATQTKVGTSASTPVANTLLFGTGTGTSAWTALTSANLAATVSDETGSGSLVFATTPTLITPKVDTINENTLNNGVTVGGVSLKAGVISTSLSVPTAAIQANAITTAKLATGANFQPRSVEQNPYSFSVYRNGAWTTGSAAFALVTFDTKLFDTGTNYSTSTGLFTCPLAGKYQFNFRCATAAGVTRAVSRLNKNNGTEIARGTDLTTSSANQGSGGSRQVLLALNDTVEVDFFTSAAVAGDVGIAETYFDGYLVSAS